MYHDLIFFVPEHSTNFEKAKDKNSRKQMVTDNYVCLYTGGDWFKQYYFVNIVSWQEVDCVNNFIQSQRNQNTLSKTSSDTKLLQFSFIFTRGVLIHVIEILSKHIYMLCSPLLIKVWKRARAVVGSTLEIFMPITCDEYNLIFDFLTLLNENHIDLKLFLLAFKKYRSKLIIPLFLLKCVILFNYVLFYVSEALERLLLQVFMNHMDESAKSSSNVHYLTSVVPEATLPATVPGEQYLLVWLFSSLKMTYLARILQRSWIFFYIDATFILFLTSKMSLLVLVTAQCLLNQFSLRVSLDVFDLIMYDNRIRLAKKGIGEESVFIYVCEVPFMSGLPEVLLHKYTLCALLIVMAVALLLINRQVLRSNYFQLLFWHNKTYNKMEVTSRLLFVWKETVEEQKAQVEDMRHKNEALVYNILPPHVAKHFLGAKKKDEELYSLSYDSVGVLFASMPNFSDFYTEETVNNQGIECLRFLNEVISDYDALLEQPAFRDITKIKTIGSTYMAASGLKSENEIPNSDKEKCHLAVLTEFALALRRTLNGINEQSFNNFILRIGINHGPITAGVIGARKPHYDVWGNTVNVASRMESTGKAGSIQVVEETKNILENFGYGFEQRGLVSVKGKGKLMTYYLIGKESKDDKSNIVPNSLST
ncbi:Adenylate cyclase type 3 [Nymphon striatum]|nr:Adenylate cyclase type 3 [Nymphon striatum]